MKHSEKNFEDILYNNIDNEVFPFYYTDKTWKRRQFNIKGYGICDIITAKRSECYPSGRGHYCSDITISIYEIKKGAIDINTLAQTLRYADGVKKYMYKRGFRDKFWILINLVGKEVKVKKDHKYIFDLISSNDLSVKLYTYKYDFNEISMSEVPEKEYLNV